MMVRITTGSPIRLRRECGAEIAKPNSKSFLPPPKKGNLQRHEPRHAQGSSSRHEQTLN